MFTGIIEAISKVKSISGNGSYNRLVLESPSFYSEINPGDSISVCGICLTAEKINKSSIFFSVMKDTIQKTSISFLKSGNIVNIERALEVGNRIDGHLVSGHVDCSLKISNIKKDNQGFNIFLNIPSVFRDFLYKGSSIAIEGVSLTVQEYDFPKAKVSIIPETLNRTNLKFKKTGDIVNIEFDMLLKKSNRKRDISIDYLNSLGYK